MYRTNRVQKRLRSMVCIGLTLMLLLSLIGCTGTTTTVPTTGTTTTGEATTKDTSAATSGDTTTTTSGEPTTTTSADNQLPEQINPMPIVEGDPVHLTYWCGQDGYSATILKSQNEMRCFQELNRITNMNVEFIHPAVGSGSESLMLLISSGDIPDIIGSYTWAYPGGIMKGVTDGVFLPLNDYLDKYAPYYQRLRKENPDIEKETMNDEGIVAGFGQIQADMPAPWFGGMIRKDFLDNAGLGVPKTISDWYVALTEFKKAGVEFPLNFNMIGDTWGGYFINAYGIGYDFYIKNDHITYAFIEPEYKEFLTEMSKWWAEGLLDPDYATRDGASRDEIIINGKCGASQNGNWQVYNLAIVEKGLGDFVCPPYPIIEGREQAKFRQQNVRAEPPSTVVTTACKTPELAIRWLDYNYSEEGFMLRNFGVEGESYTLVEGQMDEMQFGNPEQWANYLPLLWMSGKHPQFTDEIVKNPDGYEFYVALSKYKTHTGTYLRGDRTGEREAPFFADARYDTWNYPTTEQNLPPLSFTTAESERIAALRADIDTYRSEEAYKFLTGARPLTEFDAFVTALQEMNLAELTEIYETAFQRYQSRGSGD